MANDTQNTNNPLSGLLAGSSGGGPTNMVWDNLTGHEKATAWGSINDIFVQILGRQATLAEAKKYYNEGISNYALGQQLMMSKEFTHTALFNQLKRSYHYELAQFLGTPYKLKDKLVQSFAAHNYTTTDIQAWVYAHKNVYMQSNDYKTRVAQMKDVYSQVFGVDPYAQAPDTHHKVWTDTNKKKPGFQGGFQVEFDNPLLHHVQQAALHFQTPDQYRAYLQGTPLYKRQVLNQVDAQKQPDAGLSLTPAGRPVQRALNPHGTMADVAQ